jgi:hypothetical protein
MRHSTGFHGSDWPRTASFQISKLSFCKDCIRTMPVDGLHDVSLVERGAPCQRRSHTTENPLVSTKADSGAASSHIKPVGV